MQRNWPRSGHRPAAASRAPLAAGWASALAMLLAIGVGSNPAAAKRGVPASAPSVVVAPFVTSTAGEEYQWIASAFSEALTDRLLSSDEAHVFSQKQWAAVLRERDIAAREVSSEEDAEAIARQLGADQYVFGRFQAAWPEVTVWAKRYQVGQKEPIAEAAVTGNLSELVNVERDIAKGLFGKDFKKAARAKGPAKNVAAWRSLTLCRDALALQSIGPRATVWLPKPLAEQALGHCERALKADKKNPIALSFNALGNYIVAGDDDKQRKAALKDIAKVVKRKKRPYGWPDQIAYFLYAKEGQDKKAVAALEGAINKRPGLLHARTTLGEHHVAAGDLAAAQMTFEAALAASPKQPWVLVQLGKLKAKQGDVDGALASTDAALALVPGDAVVLMEKASRLIDGKRYKEAEVTLREAMASDPRLAAAYLRLGYVYLETNQLELAGPILNKALYEADRESEKRIKGYAHYDLAKLYARLGDPERAMGELNRAVSVGFREQARFEADPDLVEVRKLPAYRAAFPAPAADKASPASETTAEPAKAEPPSSSTRWFIAGPTTGPTPPGRTPADGAKGKPAADGAPADKASPAAETNKPAASAQAPAKEKP